VAGCCKHGKQEFGCMQYVEILEQLGKWQLLKECSIKLVGIPFKKTVRNWV